MSQLYTASELDPEELARRKGTSSVSVCLPAHDEADTVGTIVAAVRTAHVEGSRLVDELLVVDDYSMDATLAVAHEAGAKVVRSADVLASAGSRRGKGEALWKSLAAASGDLIVWLDADLVDFDPAFVTGLVGPLLVDHDLQFVKGFYDRPVTGADGGGRVTELVARPAIALWFPELSSIRQPLGGEYAGRRAALETLPFASGYGVDLALVIDVASCFGLPAIAQVDLGVRQHRNRPLGSLGATALAVLATAARRAGVDVPDHVVLDQPGAEPADLVIGDRPPLVDLDEYRREQK